MKKALFAILRQTLGSQKLLLRGQSELREVILGQSRQREILYHIGQPALLIASRCVTH